MTPSGCAARIATEAKHQDHSQQRAKKTIAFHLCDVPSALPSHRVWVRAAIAMVKRRDCFGARLHRRFDLEPGDAATSGDYRHWVEIDGRRISHTMDPRTDHLLRGALTSVTVFAPVCADADAYATALMVLGEEAGHEHPRRLGLDAFLVARDGDRLRATGTAFFGGA